MASKVNQSQLILGKHNYMPWLVSAILLIFDILAIVSAYLLSFEIRNALNLILGRTLDIPAIYPMIWLSLILIVGLFGLNGLYPGVGRTGIVELYEIVKLVTISYISIGLAVYVWGFGNTISRSVFILSYVIAIGLLSFFRLLFHNRGSLTSWWNKPVLVVGNEADVEKVIRSLKRARRMALMPVVALIFDKGFAPSEIHGVLTYPYSKHVQDEIRRKGISQVIIANDGIELGSKHKSDLYALSLTFPRMIYVLGESPISSLSIKTFDLEGRPALQVRYNLLDPWLKAIKRIIDLLICLLSLFVTIPMFIFFALLIRIDSPGPIIFKQTRLGKDGKVFDLYKFRTMQVNAEQKLTELLDKDKKLQVEYKKFHKLQKDPRITRVGRFLRKSSFDEFPQILNVIKGDMSWVGPRAYMPREKPEMGEYADLIHRVRPGLTGWWQVMGRHDVSFAERLKLDEYYISNFSLWMDFYILLKTVWVVISGQGA